MEKSKGWTKILTFFFVIVLGFHLIHLILLWPDIPDRIAIHFMNGDPGNGGAKWYLLIMPVIGVLTWWLLGRLTKYPEKLNYINLTEENRDRQYKMMRKTMEIMQNLVFLTFILANEAFLRDVLGAKNDIFFFLSIASLLLIPLGSFFNLVWAARLS
ncbi:DUF1648 domain-containing protein [Halobacillus ihumii]|uniref:DUF1648 domain-containing protein n=1 Tax=Halobacillus ihumii TaxID=2686092 RepID=UPI0013D3A153|nr:DUF1648 domain-containing protein [Halobacillus ihumii]